MKDCLLQIILPTWQLAEYCIGLIVVLGVIGLYYFIKLRRLKRRH